MNDVTARVILQADIEMLMAAAARLNKQMRVAATTFLGSCVTLATILVGIANLAGKPDKVDLDKVYQSNKAFLGVAGCFLYALGIVLLLSYSRDRKHYVKIVTALNDLRKCGCDILSIEGEYATLWTHSRVSTWPGDSATTVTFIALSISTIAVLTGALFALSLPLAAIILVGALCFVTQSWLALTVSE